MCAGQADQLACALDDLKDSFAKIQDVVDFLSEEAATIRGTGRACASQSW
jgi:hypothetical protein